MERIHGEAGMHSEDGDVEAHLRMSYGESRRYEDEGELGGLAGEARDRLTDLGNRAGGLAGRLRGTVEERLSDLEERTGLVAAIRTYPLPALAVAFAGGFVVAAATASDDGNWVLERARRRIRGAIIAGVAALLAQELREAIGGEEGLGEFVQSFLGDEDQEVDL